MKILFCIYMVSVLAILSACDSHGTSKDNRVSPSTTSGMTQKYTCTMHPNVIRDSPGNCPVCGMKLVPVKTTADTTGTDHR